MALEKRVKISFDVEKIVIFRKRRGMGEKIHFEFSEETQKRINSIFEGHDLGVTLNLTIPRGSGELICDALGIPPSLVSVFEDGKEEEKTGTEVVTPPESS